jgi:hypothetical protein
MYIKMNEDRNIPGFRRWVNRLDMAGHRSRVENHFYTGDTRGLYDQYLQKRSVMKPYPVKFSSPNFYAADLYPNGGLLPSGLYSYGLTTEPLTPNYDRSFAQPNNFDKPAHMYNTTDYQKSLMDSEYVFIDPRVAPPAHRGIRTVTGYHKPDKRHKQINLEESKYREY